MNAPHIMTGNTKMMIAKGKITEALIQNGFGKVKGELPKKYNLIFNRALDPDGNPKNISNFFVFLRANPEGALLELMHANPDTSNNAILLPAKKISVVYRTGGTFSDKSIECAIENILADSGKKPENIYFINPHSHLGYVGEMDLFGLGIDDGFSSSRSAGLLMALNNIDIDAAGHHNHIIRETVEKIEKEEKELGIIKTAGCELTLPYKSGKLNGPHINLWFATKEAAYEFADKVLSKRGDRQTPSFAPDMDTEEILNIINEMRKRGVLALGIAHPAANKNLMGVGLVNRIAMGDYSVEYAEEFVKNYADAVGAFNLTNPKNQEIPFVNKQDKEYFEGLAVRWGLGKKLTPNVLCLAYAYEMNEKFNLPYYGDLDVHYNPEVEYNSRVDTYSQMINKMIFENRPDTQKIVEEIKKGNLEAFIPFEKGIFGVEITGRRRNDGITQKITEFIKEAVHVFRMIRAVSVDIYNNVKESIGSGNKSGN